LDNARAQADLSRSASPGVMAAPCSGQKGQTQRSQSTRKSFGMVLAFRTIAEARFSAIVPGHLVEDVSEPELG